MRRPIYFKAKCISDGSWVTGSYWHRNEGDFIIAGECKFAVSPSTVCQFTGQKDKNGVEVWEHDLLTNDGSIIYEVGYEDCGFKASLKGENEFIYNLVAVCKYNYICGNKFDGKED